MPRAEKGAPSDADQKQTWWTHSEHEVAEEQHRNDDHGEQSEAFETLTALYVRVYAITYRQTNRSVVSNAVRTFHIETDLVRFDLGRCCETFA